MRCITFNNKRIWIDKNSPLIKLILYCFAIGMAVIIVGFLLMTGPSSTEGYFEPDIFSVRRIKVAPAVCFFGFIFMIYGIVRKPKDKTEVVNS